MRQARFGSVASIVAFIVALSAITGLPAAAESNRASGRLVWSNSPDSSFTRAHLVTSMPDGRGYRPLTPDMAGVADIEASLSPSGARMVYERDIGDDVVKLRIIDIDGRNDPSVDFGCRAPCLFDLAPIWLPNGRIAFSRVVGPFDDRGPVSDALYTARPDGRDLRRLSPDGTDGVYEDAFAGTAPGADYVVFRRNETGGEAGLFRMAPDGSDVRQLVPFAMNANNFDVSPARWGVTKDLIVFETAATGNPFLDIATVPANCPSLAACTAQIRFLTHNAGVEQLRNGNPTWSPTGREIAFTNRTSLEAPTPDIWSMRYDGSHRQQISHSAGLNYSSEWGPKANRENS